MSKIPAKPIIKAVKAAAPEVKKYIKQNPRKVGGAALAGFKAGKKIIDDKEKRFEKKKSNGKVHYRKIRHLEYHNDVLPKLDTYSYMELNSYKREVESYIKQINQEEVNQFVINKPLHSKRLKSWRQIHIQIEDTIKNRNYDTNVALNFTEH